MPIRCNSVEKLGETPEVKLKISEQNDHTLAIGITPIAKPRFAAYVTASVNESSVGLNFVEHDTLLGYLYIESSEELGTFKGKFSHSSVSSKILNLTCIDLQIYPEN